jgi:menaquinone-dependent protoporphyrinogen IX oxidase
MKIGIIYATKRKEATVQIVKWIKVALEKSGHTAVAKKVEDFDDFDCDQYILGTAIYIFSVNRAGIINFLRKNKNNLKNKPCNFFIVCGANKLPPQKDSKDKPLIKFLKYTFLDPDKYMRGLVAYLPQGSISKTASFKGYQEESDKITEKFEAQEVIVTKWAESLLN